MHQYVLETDRLILRPLTVNDAEAEFVWLSDPEVNRFMPYNLYTSVDEARNWLRHVEQETTEYHFGFVRREDGLLIGAGSIGPADEPCYAHLPGAWAFGYNLRRDCWNRGYATEALTAAIAELFRLGFDTVRAGYFSKNAASGRVMEKSGMRRIDHTDTIEYRGAEHLCFYYEIRRDTFTDGR